MFVGSVLCPAKRSTIKNAFAVRPAPVDDQIERRIADNSAVPIGFAVDNRPWKPRRQAAAGDDMIRRQVVDIAVEDLELPARHIDGANQQAHRARLERREVDILRNQLPHRRRIVIADPVRWHRHRSKKDDIHRGLKKFGTPNIRISIDVATRAASCIELEIDLTERSAQKDSRACVAWRGLAATIAPFKAPIETPAMMSGKICLFLQCLHDTAFECAERAAPLQDQNGLRRNAIERKSCIAQSILLW